MAASGLAALGVVLLADRRAYAFERRHAFVAAATPADEESGGVGGGGGEGEAEPADVTEERRRIEAAGRAGAAAMGVCAHGLRKVGAWACAR